VLVTLPLGVLQARANETGAVKFLPALAEKAAAAQSLAMGRVVKIVLRFRERFWEELELSRGDERVSLSDLAFLHAPGEPFPTWWTQLPRRAPLLVGWAGGAQADAFTSQAGRSIRARALDTLARVLAFPRERIEGLLEESYTHDWGGDPFARGAYSYVPAGALGAQERLARAVDDTLYFAGEATNAEGHCGTVHGAIATGLRAAREIRRGARR
jgi:monoamine oxidase